MRRYGLDQKSKQQEDKKHLVDTVFFWTTSNQFTVSRLPLLERTLKTDTDCIIDIVAQFYVGNSAGLGVSFDRQIIKLSKSVGK